MRLRIVLMNRVAFQPRFIWRKNLWSRRGVFLVRSNLRREAEDAARG